MKDNIAHIRAHRNEEKKRLQSGFDTTYITLGILYTHIHKNVIKVPTVYIET